MDQVSTPTFAASRRLPWSTTRRILVAEDLATIRDIASAMLTRAGFEVDVAADGVEACRLAAEHRYDLIFMDVYMPEMDGVAATATIRDLEEPYRSVPIVAMTAEKAPDRLRTLLAAGMDDILSKPFARRELFATIEGLIGDSSSRPRAEVA